MVGTLGKVAGRRKRMVGELASADLHSPAKSLVKSMTYQASRQVVDPSAHRPATDDRHLVMEKWVQAALNVALGLRLKIDGVLKGDTRAALVRFQKQAGLTATGCIDEKTLMALELEVGVRAPRDGRYETLPRHLQFPHTPQRLPAPPEAPKTPPRTDQAPIGAVAAAAHGSADQRQGHEPAREAAAVDPVLAGLRAQAAAAFLQREALDAAVRIAFDREFTRLELGRMGRQGSAALQSEMVAWYERQASGDGAATAWLPRVREAARESQADAVALLRQAWQHEHP